MTESKCWCLCSIVERGNLVTDEKLHQSALGFDWGVEKPFYRRKTPLVVGGTRTQVLADSKIIAASALDHCTT